MTAEKNLREAAEKVLADWYTLASSLPQNDSIEALEWGAMQELRAAINQSRQQSIPIGVEFAVSYLDGVMKAERPEIQSKWAKVRAFLDDITAK